MQTFIVLLRGINVSGKNKLPMVALRSILQELSFYNVQTYIQSGNIILTSEHTKSVVCEKIRIAILEKFGYSIPVLAKTISEWEIALKNYPFPTSNEKIVAFTFLEKVPEIEKISISNLSKDQYKIAGDMVYLYCPNGLGKSKITNTLLERKLNVVATTRNLRTTLKLLDLAKIIL